MRVPAMGHTRRAPSTDVAAVPIIGLAAVSLTGGRRVTQPSARTRSDGGNPCSYAVQCAGSGRSDPAVLTHTNET